MRAQTADISARDKILDAAEALFARRGYAAVGMSEIAEAVGLSKSSLFHHFPTKAQLYAATADRILRVMEAALTTALAAGGSPVQRLDRWIDTIADLLGAHEAYARLLLRSLFEDDELSGAFEEERAVNETLHRVIGAATQLLREGMSSGALRAASIPHTVQSLIGLLIYHFASGDFGAELLGRPITTPAEVRRRKDEIKALLHHGLVAPRAAHEED
ncbi:TetR/AcrR family transcriptional regulator [bacterium]|nr:TetR/AcrR family transcriptional regulator [bacterium]